MSLMASLLPWSSSSGQVTIDIFIVTGRHGILSIPESFCEECHLFVQAAEMAAEQVEADVTVNVRSWWTQFPLALLHGGYHPPVLLVDGKGITQGEDVPSVDDITDAIQDTS